MLGLTQRTLYRFVFFLAMVAILGYGLYQARNIFYGPTITVETPQNGSAVSSSDVHITGSTARVTGITLNDRPIFIDETGRFDERLLLASGYNVLELTVHDRFGRERTELLELIYQPPLSR